MKDNSLAPATLTLDAPRTVVWRNTGASPHTVTADDKSFDSGGIDPGTTFSHAFTTTGTFRYHCSYHTGMNGTIVIGTPAPTPTTTPSPTPAPTPSPTPAPTPTPTPTPTAPIPTASVSIMNFEFQPSTLNVVNGTEVTWGNGDGATHTVTADDQSFASGSIANGGSYAHRFTAAGTYAYHCAIHSSMHGTVVVS